MASPLNPLSEGEGEMRDGWGEDFILYIYNICIFVKKKFKRVWFAGEKTPAKASFLQNLKSKNGTPTGAN